VPPEKLYLNPDCGFRRVARWIAVKKMRAMVEGTAIIRKELGG